MSPEAFIALGQGLGSVRAKTIEGATRLMVGGLVIANVGWPEAGWAIVRLTPADQAGLMTQSLALAPEPGPRGRKGMTLVRLADVSEAVAGRVLLAAWRLAAQGGATRAKAG